MKKGALNFIAFFSLFIVAVLVLINNILPLIGVSITGMFVNVLETIKDIFFIINRSRILYVFYRLKLIRCALSRSQRPV